MTLQWARWRLVSIGLVLLAALAGDRVAAQSASGADVKAAFLFNFAKFVEWPAGALPAGQPIVVGVMGHNPIADSLARLAAGKTIEGHAVQIKRVASTDDLTTLQILFIDNSERGRVSEIVGKIGKASVLTVSDAPRFLASGGVIQLRTEDDRVRFDVDLERAKTAQLTINSKLLALAGTINPAKTH